jgi:hypothetical protein
MAVGRSGAKRGANLVKIRLGLPRAAAGQKLYLHTKNSVLRVLIAIFLLLVATSCFEEGDCLITNSHYVKVTLLGSETRTEVTILFDSVYTPGYTAYYKNVAAKRLELPVNPGETQMLYVLRYLGKVDSVRFGYDNLTVVHSPTCGAFPYQRNLAVLESTFPQDSVVVTDPSLLKNGNENVRIYF